MFRPTACLVSRPSPDHASPHTRDGGDDCQPQHARDLPLDRTHAMIARRADGS
jgi:hypothetical protein